ncbi:hypothetical protein FA13DRAFT_1750867 [Coprinellus micaceus]|uniref:[Histone H3]-trimethyl-L-lysine(4) demethylase n=1 Tax=Coprinellus micaceus TaxID=71717 RepID=A0A4Y7R5F5_COPMI|nr:hypothetical protein FA13DRAFT_1750867 [Coprinellus micaceus]
MPQPGSSTVPQVFKQAPATFISSLDIPVEGAIPIETEPENTPLRTAPLTPNPSKTEAMTAMNNQARSASVEVSEEEELEDLAERYRNAPIPVASKFNLSSRPQGPRPLGLEDCPEFFPTAEEFKDPMAYIKSISDKAKDYGICKIIPPQGWKMPFVTDTETFRFKTRLQRVVVPTINHKPLDLWLLRKEVQRLGGYDAVTKGKKWSDLGRILGYRGIPGLSTQIKNSYTRVILPFEHFCERVKNSPALSPLFSRDAHLKTHMNIQGSSTKATKLILFQSRQMSPTARTTKAPQEHQDDFGRTIARPLLTIVLAPKKGPVVPPPTFHDRPDRERTKEEQHCEICHKKNRGEEMLLCDGCDCEQWFCFTCLAGTGGTSDSTKERIIVCLPSKLAISSFRKLWFETHPPPGSANRMVDDEDPTVTRIGNVYVSEDDVENEFWRLVASPNETVEIEYGADVHSTTHGSAMPTMETHPLNPYSKDPWNLNNIPILPDSLLRYIKSDISGMTVPWTYVGMAFSTFCWHNEVLHWGETKTWYGIPGEDAEKFEAAIKQAGVRVYRCNQRAGELVITFPKAYHAGFNHGLNFNEAVNFALPEWLPIGRECIKRYREHRKLPVFSQDELLITITQQSQSIKTAMWLIDSLREMTEREFDDRQKARDRGVTEILKEEDSAEDQYQCTSVVCQCTNRVVCADHIDLLCENRPSHNIDVLSRVQERANIPSAWRTKLHRPHQLSPPEMVNLRKCVTRANEWVDFANSFLIRKQSRKRAARKSRGHPNDRPDRGLDELYTHLREVEVLGFDSPEIATLKNLAQQAEETKTKASKLLKATPEEQEQSDFLQDCKRILLEGSSLNVVLEELAEMEKILEEKLDDDDDPQLTLEEVRQYLTRARACGLSSENKHMKFLESRQKDGDSWQDRANKLLEKPIKTIAELEEFADMDSSIPINPTTVDRLKSLRSKALDFKKQAKQWMTPLQEGSPKPRISDVLRLCQRSEKDFRIAEVLELKRTAEIAIDLESRCEQVLRGRFVVQPGEDIFKMIEGWRVCEQIHDTPPNDEYMTCICTQPVRPPPPGVPSDAVQCDHCFARFHGDCAKNGGSCPFSDTIVARVDRLSASIGQFLSYTSQPVNQRPEYLPTVKHFMRKLYRIQFAVSPNPTYRLHRILATRPAVTRPKKRRRRASHSGSPKVECSGCSRLYHIGCVFFPQDENVMGRVPLFYCPICCLKKGRRYEFSDIRVRPVEGLGPKVDPDVYLIYKRLPPPIGRTLFVDLVSWMPGTDAQSTTAPPPSSVSRSSVVPPLQTHQPLQHHIAVPLYQFLCRCTLTSSLLLLSPLLQLVFLPISRRPGSSLLVSLGHSKAARGGGEVGRAPSSSGPITKRRVTHSSSTPSTQTSSRAPSSPPIPPAPQNHPPTPTGQDPAIALSPAPGSVPGQAAVPMPVSALLPPAPLVHSAPPPPPAAIASPTIMNRMVSPASPASRPVQILSPSLAMIVSPTNEEPQTSPRVAFNASRPPVSANGSSPSVSSKPILP